VQRGTNWGRAVGAVEVSHGFANALREELDLRIEARNMTSVATASAGRGGGSVRIPVRHQPLCGETVLVMERLDGRTLAIRPASPTPCWTSWSGPKISTSRAWNG